MAVKPFSGGSLFSSLEEFGLGYKDLQSGSRKDSDKPFRIGCRR